MANLLTYIPKKIFHSKLFHRPAVRLYSIFKPPPYKQDNSEFHRGLWHTISTFHGERCRPLGENNAFPAIYRENTETDHQRCKFAGSRYGKEINMTSLREASSVWTEAMQLTIALRNNFMEYRGLSNKQFNLKQNFVFCKAGAAIPSYLARRTTNALKNGELPIVLQAYFSLGVVGMVMVESLMEKGDLIVLEDQRYSDEELGDMAENSGALISDPKNPDTKVCAGSPSAIKNYLNVLINGEYEIEEYFPDVEKVFDLIGDMDRFYSYMYAACRMELYSKINQYINANALYILNKNIDSLDEDKKPYIQKNIDYLKKHFGRELIEPEKMKDKILIALTLIEEIDAPDIREELHRKQIFDKNLFLNIETNNPVEKVINDVNVVTKMMFESSKYDLDIVNTALGITNPKKINLDDMYMRVSGPYMRPLVESN